WLWSTSTVHTQYSFLLIASVILAAGLALAMAPATESIMGALPPEQAGVGSAVNDTTRELGGALGVAGTRSPAPPAFSPPSPRPPTCRPVTRPRPKHRSAPR